MFELTESQSFVFLHPTDHQKAWDGNGGFTTQLDDWWRTRDLQEFGNKQIELTMQGLVYRPVVMDLVPEELTEGPNVGKWVLRIDFMPADLELVKEAEEGEEWKEV